VTKTHPVDGAHVGVLVDTVANAQIRIVAHGGGVENVKAARADTAGEHTFWYRVSNAPPGYRVALRARVSRDGRRASCTTQFEPARKVHVSKPAPAPAKAASPAPTPAPAPPRSAAWCTATASIYDAYWNDNNVYVHSNQPYTDATASADGYSWSYETNGSGYAEIWLNGPPPGAEITVTVGRATCTTSD
jgi:hypothetical protein